MLMLKKKKISLNVRYKRVPNMFSSIKMDGMTEIMLIDVSITIILFISIIYSYSINFFLNEYLFSKIIIIAFWKLSNFCLKAVGGRCRFLGRPFDFREHRPAHSR